MAITLCVNPHTFVPVSRAVSTATNPSRDAGQILVLTTVSMVVLLGIMALSVDASFMFEKRNRLHAAADAAAKAAAIELVRNPSVSQAALEKFADQEVIAHGLLPVRQGGSAAVTINHPPASGTFAGNSRYVEAVISEPTSTFFARTLGWQSMTPLASAVAGAEAPPACLITIDNLTIGNSAISLNGCGAAVGADLSGTNPNSRIVGTPTPSVNVVGACWGTCVNMGSLTTKAPAPIDPLKGLAAPDNPGGCTAGVSPTLRPGCYSDIANTVTTLLPGEYYITGRVNIDTLTGDDVLLYLTGSGNLFATNNKSLHLTGRRTGPYRGIAIFQNAANISNFVTGNNFELDVTGAIYMPGSYLDYPNSLWLRTTSCTLFLAKSLSIRNGNGALNGAGCLSAFPGAAFLPAFIAQ